MTVLNEERILDFLDGRLGTGEEEELLHTLAVSPERRQVLHEHLRLREITNTISGHERFNVPPHVTSQLFATLGSMGYVAPATTEAILTKAPQFVQSKDIQRGMAAVAVGAYSGWRLGITSLVTASVMSFLLGAGALYVFGSGLGIRTLSQQKQYAQAHSFHSGLRPIHSDYSAVTAADLNEAAVVAPVITHAASIPAHTGSDLGSMAVAMPDESISATPISYAAPRQRNYLPIAHLPVAASAPILPDWGMAIPSPFANEQGIISARYGMGTTPGSPSTQMSSLSELKFTWHLWKFVTARASMGELTSYERAPLTPPMLVANGKYEITTALTRTMNTLIGGELGFSLDPLGIPFEATGGVMIDGSGSRAYWRGGIFAHFEPSHSLTISAGIEGLIYRDDVDNTIKNNAAAFANYNSPPTAAGNGGKQTAGFIGPALEIGWHF